MKTRVLTDGAQAVTFDVGSTLIECTPSVGHIYADEAARHGWPGISPQILNQRFRTAWALLRDFHYTRDQWASLVDATFGDLVNQPPSQTFFPALYARFARRDAWRVFEDVFQALQRLAGRGLKLGILSNWDDRLRPLLRELELERWFSVVVISCEHGVTKPDPKLFLTAARLLSVTPSRIVHVGDSAEMDCAGAQAAGFRPLLLRRAQPSSRGQIRSLAELS